jgi:serine-type anaerobic sulfatase-maturating enzyme
MNDFSLLIKPASADCNLNCEYCFYLKKCELYPERQRHRMSDDVLERLIQSYMETSQPVYSFGWQGGEPTLMGTEFFEKVVSLQKKYGKSGSNVGNGLQTNATLIDDRMAQLFGEYHFLLGCSLDGPPHIHDLYRRNLVGSPSYDMVLKGINALKRNKVEFNVLVLVSQANVKHAKEVYDFLVGQGYYFHQYIPCVEFDEKGNLLPFAITGEEWGDFLCDIYDQWYPKDTHTVSIRHFDSILTKLVDHTDNVCTMGRNCCQYFVVEHNGDIYPCDFFVEDPLKLGNIMEMSWEELSHSPVYREFGNQKSQWNKMCEQCEWLTLCNGDCLKHRVYGGHQPHHLSYLCSGWKVFFNHTQNGFDNLAGEITQKRRDEEQQAIANRADVTTNQGRVGRNAPCPCGSGLKYKKCCGKTP